MWLIVVGSAFLVVMFCMCIYLQVRRGMDESLDEYDRIMNSLSANYDLKDYEFVELMEFPDSWILLRYGLTDMVSERTDVTKPHGDKYDTMRLFLYNLEDDYVFEVPYQCP